MIMLIALFICGLSVTEMCSLIGALTAFISVFVAFCKYDEHVRRGRIEYLLNFGNKYTSDGDIKKVINFLEKLEDNNMHCCEKMKDNMTYTEEAISIHSIEMYMRFIEELELLIRSGSVSESAALNLFGYYTTILDKYNSRWPKLNYNSKFWNVYRSFVIRAKNFNYNNVSV